MLFVDSPAKSTADIGRLPVALEKEDGADDVGGDARAGNTKDGSGRGLALLTRVVSSSMTAGGSVSAGCSRAV